MLHNDCLNLRQITQSNKLKMPGAEHLILYKGMNYRVAGIGHLVSYFSINLRFYILSSQDLASSGVSKNWINSFSFSTLYEIVSTATLLK